MKDTSVGQITLVVDSSLRSTIPIKGISQKRSAVNVLEQRIWPPIIQQPKGRSLWSHGAGVTGRIQVSASRQRHSCPVNLPFQNERGKKKRASPHTTSWVLTAGGIVLITELCLHLLHKVQLKDQICFWTLKRVHETQRRHVNKQRCEACACLIKYQPKGITVHIFLLRHTRLDTQTCPVCTQYFNFSFVLFLL